MNTITLLVLLITLIACILVKKMQSPLGVFSLIWLIVILLYELRLIDLFNISFNTELVLFLGVTGFIIGYLLFQKIEFKKPSKKLNELSYKRLVILSCITFFASLPFYLPNVLFILRGNSIESLKYGLVTGQIDLGGALMQYFVRPVSFIIIAIASYFIVVDRHKKTVIFLGILFAILDYIGGASKSGLFFLLICVLLSSLEYTNLKMHFEKKMLIFAFSGLSIMVFLFITLGFKRIYIYLTGSIPMLDKILNTNFYMHSGHSNGRLSINSAFRLIYKTLETLGVNITDKSYELANDYFLRFEHTTNIAYDIQYNAFHTMFGDFYIDFGFAGVFIMSLLFGIFSCWVYNKIKKDRILLRHTLYSILLYYIIFGVVRFQMSNTYFGLMLIYSVIFLERIIYKKHKNNRIDMT